MASWGSNLGPGGSQMAFWRPPGASWAAGQAQERALGGKGSLFFFETGKKSSFSTSRVHLGHLLAGFGAMLGPFPPSVGRPGEARELIF